jgi:hypothetical protein
LLRFYQNASTGLSQSAEVANPDLKHSSQAKAPKTTSQDGWSLVNIATLRFLRESANDKKQFEYYIRAAAAVAKDAAPNESAL